MMMTMMMMNTNDDVDDDENDDENLTFRSPKGQKERSAKRKRSPLGPVIKLFASIYNGVLSSCNFHHHDFIFVWQSFDISPAFVCGTFPFSETIKLSEREIYCMHIPR